MCLWLKFVYVVVCLLLPTLGMCHFAKAKICSVLLGRVVMVQRVRAMLLTDWELGCTWFH